MKPKPIKITISSRPKIAELAMPRRGADPELRKAAEAANAELGRTKQGLEALQAKLRTAHAKLVRGADPDEIPELEGFEDLDALRSAIEREEKALTRLRRAADRARQAEHRSASANRSSAIAEVTARRDAILGPALQAIEELRQIEAEILGDWVDVPRVIP